MQQANNEHVLQLCMRSNEETAVLTHPKFPLSLKDRQNTEKATSHCFSSFIYKRKFLPMTHVLAKS
jgi:hypothetical protein